MPLLEESRSSRLNACSAAFLLANDLSALVLEDLLTATLGESPLSEQGMARWTEVLLLGLDFGLLALAAGVVTGKRGIALAVGAGVASVAYLISSLAPVVHWVHRIRFASPFFWAVGNNQLAHGPSAVELLVLTGVAVVLLGTALVAVRRLDIP